MAWADEAAKTASRKIVLAEIDIGYNFTQWVNEGPGIWKGTLYWAGDNVAYGYEECFLLGPYEENGDADITNEEWTSSVTVGSVQEDGSDLTERATYALMYANTGSYFWDEDNQEVFVNMTNSDYVHEHTMVLGITLKITNDSAANDLGEGYYAERLRAIPSVTKSKDALTHGLIQHGGGTIEVENLDGALDWIANADAFGQQVVVKHGFDGQVYADFQQVIKNHTDGIEIDYRSIKFFLRDDRQKLTYKLPDRGTTLTGMPNLPDKDVGKMIPILYGEVKNAGPLICQNGNQSGTPNWTFKVCDHANHANGIESIDAVYVDGVEKTITASNLTNCTVTIANADYSGTETVTCDAKGYHDGSDVYIETALDVIKDLMVTYLGITYDATNFDTTEWASATSDGMNNNVGLWIDEPTEIIEIIEKLCHSVNGNFIKKDEDGLYTFRFTDESAAASKTIVKEDYLGSPVIRPDVDNIISTIRVGYDHDIEEDEYTWWNDRGQRTRVVSKYTIDHDYEMETFLISEAEAIELANSMLGLYDDAEPIVEVELWWKYLDLEIMDVVQLPVQRVDGSNIIPEIIAEIVGLSKEPATGSVTIRARRLRNAS